MNEEIGNQFNNLFFLKVLDQLCTNIYITDMETDEIIYMNHTMMETFHLKEYKGQICWKVLQKGMKQRCSFCRKMELIEGKKICVWNENNSLNGRSYKNYDSLIEWQGKTYHIQNSTDVTEYMELSENASMDELTKMFNRRAGKEQLTNMIERAERENKVLTVAMYDINNLKKVNDQYGHREGDRLLCYIADISKQCLGKQDIIFRLSGDEFVLVFYDETINGARNRIEKVLKELFEKRETSGIFYEASFSYGLVDLYPGEYYTAAELIARADEKMYLKKRNYHIMQAKEQLALKERETGISMGFQYDGNHLYDALAFSTDDYIFIGNMKSGVFHYPPAMVIEFGLPGEIVENAAAFWGKLIHPHDERGFLESNQEIADGRVEHHCIEYRAKNVKGEWIWLRCRGRMIRDDHGIPEMFAGFITNLGKKKQIDHTTGLSNRFTFEGNIKKYLVEKQKVRRMGILLLDMDSFKNINDLYSRSFGDEVLRVSAQRISVLLPGNAEIYRLDGDEFGIILLNEREEEYAEIYASIQEKFHRQQEYNGKKYYCTVSAGYASYPQDADNYQDLLKCANISLEYSKLNGKNKVTRFSENILDEKERKLNMVEMLRESIERGFAGFSISYQPQIDTVKGKLYGAEALARWRCERFGEVCPGEFIPLLEQNGLIVRFGYWILRHSIQQCREWIQYKEDFHISVNLSYLQLFEENLIPEIEQILKEFSLPPKNLTLELTENYWIKEESLVGKQMKKMHDLGIMLAMDDFGVGYSSLVSLKNIPVDIVKIDRGFVRGITSDLFKATFVRSITELCHNVGKIVCLEGVETKEEYDAVKDTGLELNQGYYFGFPISAKMFEKTWL